MRRWVSRFALLAVFAGGCTYSPPRSQLAAPPLAESTQIFDVQGRLITQLHGDENRENVRLSELPQHLIDAVIAIEDDRFWQHKGVDVKAILRAAVTNTEEGSVAQGGSTITQQYVKNALLTDEKSINRKVQEALLAIQLERSSTKERILELYLNTIYFGNGAYGVQAASKEYFGLAAHDIDVAQAALLAGLIQSPSRTDPYDRPVEAMNRRDIVLDRMAELGLLPKAAARFAELQPVVVQVKPEQERYPAAHFVEQVKRFVLDDPQFGSTAAERRQLLFGGGLRIYTTLDLDKQALAEYAVAQVRPPAPGPDAALISMQPATGHVQAMVGGRDFFGGGERAKLDLVTGGPGRPAGSSFKPLVLAAAIEQGMTLDREFAAPSHLVIPLPTGDWKVENYEGEAGGTATLMDATVHSYNTVYAQVVMEVGPAEAMAIARKLGIKSRLLPYPSAVLGTNDVHPIDMATAYATFANRGIEVDPVFVIKITKVDGTVIYEHQHRQTRAIKEHTADEVTAALQQVVIRGTGGRARIDGRPIAGKTGTGQEWRDAWFVGFTPDVVTAIWMGFPQEGQISMKPPATPMRITGGSWPAMIWRLYDDPALAGTPVNPFPPVVLRRGNPNSIDLEDLTLPKVPGVRGVTVDKARAVLEGYGYTVQTRTATSSSVAPGTVIGQSPPGDSRLALGSVVVLTVATGAVLQNVPNVLGLTQAKATRALEDAYFTVDVIYEDGGDPGAVWAQSPGGGASAIAGVTIQIWVTPIPATTTTTGPRPTTTTTTSAAEPSTTTTTEPPTTTTTLSG